MINCLEKLIFFWMISASSSFRCRQYEDKECENVDIAEGGYFNNRLIVKINGSVDDAKTVAVEKGLKYIGPVEHSDGHYYFRNEKIPARHLMIHEETFDELESHPKVIHVNQQYVHEPSLDDLDDYAEPVTLHNPREALRRHYTNMDL